jgi:hypothetical protein
LNPLPHPIQFLFLHTLLHPANLIKAIHSSSCFLFPCIYQLTTISPFFLIFFPCRQLKFTFFTIPNLLLTSERDSAYPNYCHLQ